MSDLFLIDNLHGNLALLGRLRAAGAASAVLVGDLGLTITFPCLAESADVPLRYVPGNHDADSDALYEALLEAVPEASLHARVETLAGCAGRASAASSAVAYGSHFPARLYGAARPSRCPAAGARAGPTR